LVDLFEHYITVHGDLVLTSTIAWLIDISFLGHCNCADSIKRHAPIHIRSAHVAACRFVLRRSTDRILTLDWRNEVRWGYSISSYACKNCLSPGSSPLCTERTIRYLIYIGCPTRYRTRHFFNNSNSNEDIVTKFEQEYVHCVRNVTS
jgi:hypothetical protein